MTLLFFNGNGGLFFHILQEGNSKAIQLAMEKFLTLFTSNVFCHLQKIDYDENNNESHHHYLNCLPVLLVDIYTHGSLLEVRISTLHHIIM